MHRSCVWLIGFRFVRCADNINCGRLAGMQAHRNPDVQNQLGRRRVPVSTNQSTVAHFDDVCRQDIRDEDVNDLPHLNIAASFILDNPSLVRLTAEH